MSNLIAVARHFLVLIIFLAAIGWAGFAVDVVYAQEESSGEGTSEGASEQAPANGPPVFEGQIPPRGETPVPSATSSETVPLPVSTTTAPSPATSTSPTPRPSIPRQSATQAAAEPRSEMPTSIATTSVSTEGDSLWMLFLAAAALIFAGVGGTALIRRARVRASQSGGRCALIKTQLETKRTALRVLANQISIQEEIFDGLIEKAEETRDSVIGNAKKVIKERAKDTLFNLEDARSVRRRMDAIRDEIALGVSTERAEELAHEMANLEGILERREVIDMPEKWKGTYDEWKGAWEDAKKKLEELKEIWQVLTGEIGTLETSYATCTAGISAAEAVKDVGIDPSLPQYSPGKIELVRATPKDVELFVELENKVAGLKTYSAMTDREEALKEIVDNNVFLIKKDGAVVGTAMYEKKSDEHAHISGLVVDPKEQGKGVGNAAMKLLLEKLKEYKRVDLVTHPNNSSARTLYESLGFGVESQIDDYFGDGEPRIVMQKKSNQS